MVVWFYSRHWAPGGIKFKGDKFGWIGAPLKGIPTYAIMGFTGLKTLKDVMKSGKVLKIGATGAGSTTYDLPRILNNVLGTNFKVISGFYFTSLGSLERAWPRSPWHEPPSWTRRSLTFSFSPETGDFLSLSEVPLISDEHTFQSLARIHS